MELYNRRQVLTGISAGLAVAGVAATMPAGSASAAAAALVKDNNAVKESSLKDSATAASFDGTAEPVVAYIRDANSRRDQPVRRFPGSNTSRQWHRRQTGLRCQQGGLNDVFAP